MSRRSIVAIALIVLLAFNLTACTVSQTDFDPEANEYYKAVEVFGNNFVNNFGDRIDIWRDNVNSLSPELKQLSIEILEKFVDGEYSDKPQSDVVSILKASSEILGKNFTIFDDEEGGNLNAKIIAQLIIAMRTMTPVQKDLFYAYMVSENDEQFKNSLDSTQNAYINNTIENVNQLFSEILEEKRATNPTLTDERVAMITEYISAFSAKGSNRHLVSDTSNQVTNSVFNEIATSEMLKIIYPDLEPAEIAQEITKVKTGITMFLNSLQEPDRTVIYNALEELQIRGKVAASLGPTTPPTEPKPTTPTQKPTTDPTAKPDEQIVISDSEIETALQKAESGAKSIQFDVDVDPGAKSVEVTTSKEQIKQLFDNGVLAITYKSDLFNISFDKVAIEKDLLSGEGGDVVITARTFQIGDIKSFDKETIGDRPVFNIQLEVAGNKVSSLNGYAVISWPYKKDAAENADSLVAISDTAQYSINIFSAYNQQDEQMQFIAKRMGTFAIANRQQAFVDTQMWAEDYINYLSARDIIVGIGEGRFAPNDQVTRAQFVTMLSRISNIDTQNYTNTLFNDVERNSWYEGSVAWAASELIVLGVEDGRFAPNDNITREQMATMIARYINMATDYELELKHDKVTFSDESSISEWAALAVSNMQQAGLLTGKTGNIFDPQGLTTRAEAATVLSNLIKNMTDFYIANTQLDIESDIN